MVKRRKIEKPKEFIVMSDYGYFSGLYNGGKFKWSFEINEAKPLTNIEQFETIQKGSFGTEVILDFLK
jgi:hypothetical protein